MNDGSSQTEQIELWLAEGLRCYSEGDPVSALALWQRLLEVEADHALARQYVAFVTSVYQLASGDVAHVVAGSSWSDLVESRLDVTVPHALRSLEVAQRPPRTATIPWPGSSHQLPGPVLPLASAPTRAGEQLLEVVDGEFDPWLGEVATVPSPASLAVVRELTGGFDPWRGDTIPPVVSPAAWAAILDLPPPSFSGKEEGSADAAADRARRIDIVAIVDTVEDVPQDAGPFSDPWLDVAGSGVPLDLDAVTSLDDVFGRVAPSHGVATASHPADRPAAPLEDEVTVLMRGARDCFERGDFSGSLDYVEKVLQREPNHEEARAYLQRDEATLSKMYQSKLGDVRRAPRQLLPPDEVIWMNMHHKAGFLLAQVDGVLSYEDLLEVSGMSRFDTLRTLHELVQKGIIG